MIDKILKDYSRPQSFQKGDFIFRQGEVNRNLYYIESGILKAFYLTNDGKDFIKSFLKERDVMGNLSSCIQGIPCTFSLQCLEDTKTHVIPFETLSQVSLHDHKLSGDIISFLMALALKKENREYEFLCLDAEARYLNLVKTSPDLLDRVNLGEIAKYLGITQVALSRIRKGLS